MPEPAADLTTENAALRERIAQLEAELAMVRASTAHTVAQAQETLYWFERWGVDFNRLFARPQMEYLRKAVRGVRQIYRSAVKAKRRLLG
ncbi:MAG: hypothetical protein QM679_03040 [Patulibacter sp.]